MHIYYECIIKQRKKIKIIPFCFTPNILCFENMKYNPIYCFGQNAFGCSSGSTHIGRAMKCKNNKKENEREKKNYFHFS